MLNQITVEMSSQKGIAFCFVKTWPTKRKLQLFTLFDQFSFLCGFVKQYHMHKNIQHQCNGHPKKDFWGRGYALTCEMT